MGKRGTTYVTWTQITQVKYSHQWVPSQAPQLWAMHFTKTQLSSLTRRHVSATRNPMQEKAFPSMDREELLFNIRIVNILYDQRILRQHAWICSQKPIQTIFSTTISQVREYPSAYRGRELIQLHSLPNGQEKVAAAEDSQQTTQKGWRHLPQSCAVF